MTDGSAPPSRDFIIRGALDRAVAVAVAVAAVAADGRRPGIGRADMVMVTVVLATFNGARYLQQQLDSLAAQTRLPDVLHVCDDGSSDSTWDILAAFADVAPFPVRPVRRDQRLGAQSNFARGVEEVDGDLLFFCDQDDRWRPDKIEVVIELFARDPDLGLVLNDADLVDEHLRPMGRTLFEQHGLDRHDLAELRTGHAFRVLSSRMQPYGSTLALRMRSAKAALPLPDGQTYDQWIGQLVSVTDGVAVVQAPLQEYRQHSEQVTGFAAGSLLSRMMRRRHANNRGELARDVRRLRQLLQRLTELNGEMPSVREALVVTTGRLQLLERRERVRASLVTRPVRIALLLVSGGYHRHARGFRSAGLDLLSLR